MLASGRHPLPDPEPARLDRTIRALMDDADRVLEAVRRHRASHGPRDWSEADKALYHDTLPELGRKEA